MSNYYRITGYCEQEDFCFILDCYGCFEKLWQFSSFLVQKGLKIMHEYVMIVHKDNSLVIPILTTKKIEADVRDMKGTTWRDVVAGVLESCQSAVSLNYIYEQVEPHKKAQENKWWREKVRQTLQINPQFFYKTERGMWGVKHKVA